MLPQRQARRAQGKRGSLLLDTILRREDPAGTLAWLERKREALMARPIGLMILPGEIQAR